MFWDCISLIFAVIKMQVQKSLEAKRRYVLLQEKQYKSLMTALLIWQDHINLSIAWETVYCDYRINGSMCIYCAASLGKNPLSQTTEATLNIWCSKLFCSYPLFYSCTSFLSMRFLSCLLGSNTHSGRELITAWGLTRETDSMSCESLCCSIKSTKENVLSSHSAGCQRNTAWRILIIVSVYLCWIKSHDNPASSLEAIIQKRFILQLNNAH